MPISALTEETPSTPGWVDSRIDKVFEPFGQPAAATREAYAACLAGVRGAVDVDGGHDRCRIQALQALRSAEHDEDRITELDHALQALEAEISAGT